MEEKKVGRPKLYEDVEQMEKDIEKYFKECDKKDKPYTVSGLAYALDMDRRSLLNYSKDEKFFPTIKRAKQKIEQQLEEKGLMGISNATFTIFNLKNNFDWVDKQEQEITSNNRYNIINDLPKGKNNEWGH